MRRLLTTALLSAAFFGANASDQSPYNLFEIHGSVGETSNLTPDQDVSSGHVKVSNLINNNVYLLSGVTVHNQELKSAAANTDVDIDTTSLSFGVGGYVDLNPNISLVGEIALARVEVEASGVAFGSAGSGSETNTGYTANVRLRFKPNQGLYFDLVSGRLEYGDDDDVLRTYFGAEVTAALSREVSTFLTYQTTEWSSDSIPSIEADEIGLGLRYYY